MNEIVWNGAGLLLLKWTVLLCLAWVLHGLLRKRDARWRVALWRCVLAIIVLLPLLAAVPAPRVQIPVMPNASLHAFPSAERQSERAALTSVAVERRPAVQVQEISAVATGSKAVPSSSINSHILLSVWSFGLVIGLLRLGWLQWGLSRLRRGARVADELQTLASEIQAEMGIRRSARICVSREAHSPFLSGFLRPMVLLPERLVKEGSVERLRAVLRHEFAHLAHNDLPWSIAWRVAALLFWFHPLAWRIPAAHSLACEEEADRVAAGRPEERPAYAQVLAELALDTMGRRIPAREMQLTLNGAAQIVRRLKHLRGGSVLHWKRRHSIAAGITATLLAMFSAGWELASAQPDSAPLVTSREWKGALIIVQDEEGKPIREATIEPYSFRVKGADSASAYNWLSFGARTKQKTDAEGRVTVRYPVLAFPEEKQLTGKISLIVSHEGYSTKTTEISVDDRESVVRLARGASLEVAAYYGPDRKPVEEIVAKISGDPTPPWRTVRKGVLKCEPLPAAELMLQVMGRLPSGEIVHSEGTPITLRKGETRSMSVELKPGVRLEGRLDNHVPRPVRDGRVIVTVRSSYYPAAPVVEDFYKPQKRYGLFSHWSSYRPIAEDGTFVFESLPPGEADVIVLGDGFASKDGPRMKNRINGELVAGPPFGFPQIFPLTPGVTRIEVATERTATLRVRAKTISGEPVEGATVYINPNVMRIGTGIFGSLPKSPGEEPFQDIDFLPEPVYAAATDEEGVVLLKNVPAFLTVLDIDHPEFQVPLRGGHGRNVRFELAPGETRTLDVFLEMKGKDFIGDGGASTR